MSMSIVCYLHPVSLILPNAPSLSLLILPDAPSLSLRC